MAVAEFNSNQNKCAVTGFFLKFNAVWSGYQLHDLEA